MLYEPGLSMLLMLLEPTVLTGDASGSRSDVELPLRQRLAPNKADIAKRTPGDHDDSHAIRVERT
jgi:hypothetical protein